MTFLRFSLLTIVVGLAVACEPQTPADLEHSIEDFSGYHVHLGFPWTEGEESGVDSMWLAVRGEQVIETLRERSGDSELWRSTGMWGLPRAGTGIDERWPFHFVPDSITFSFMHSTMEPCMGWHPNHRLALLADSIPNEDWYCHSPLELYEIIEPGE
jgi:hypothetical protein